MPFGNRMCRRSGGDGCRRRDRRTASRFVVVAVLTSLFSVIPADAEELQGSSKAVTDGLTAAESPNANSNTTKDSVARESKLTKTESQWGDLIGRFVIEGDIPKPQPFSIEKDVEFCSKHNPADESLLIHPENRGIANIVVRLETKRGGNLPRVHDSYQEHESARVKLENKGCRFSPHVCLLRTSQTLVISNEDSVAHNTAAYLNRNDPFNEVTAPGKSTERNIELIERQPVKVACSIHPWMMGWLVVSDHPYAAVTDADGRFRIRQLPVGEHTVQIWQEKAGVITRGMRDGKPIEWKRGRVTLTIQPGENNLGEIHIPAIVFSPAEEAGG